MTSAVAHDERHHDLLATAVCKPHVQHLCDMVAALDRAVSSTSSDWIPNAPNLTTSAEFAYEHRSMTSQGIALPRGNTLKIEDSVAFVTGGNRGLGLAFAQALHTRGAKKVYAGVRNPDQLKLTGVNAIRFDLTHPGSIAAAAEQCRDVTLLVNNAAAGIVNAGALDPAFIELSREMFETNFYGTIRSCQAFAPVLARNRPGAIINVLSDATWFSQPMVSAYAATKSAAWSYTNALRLDLREQDIQVVGLHVGFIDTDMARGIDTKKTPPQVVADVALDELENGALEILADEQSRLVKRTLSTDDGYYLNPPPLV